MGTLRAYGWAKYWSRNGAEVTVLTCAKQPFDAPLDLSLPALPGVRVVEVGRRAGRVTRGPGALVFIAKALRDVVAALSGIVVDPRDRWIFWARETATSLAHDNDVVVSTYGPRSSHAIAKLMKKANPSLNWIADFRDLWANNHLAKLSPRARRRESRKEVATVAPADLMTTVSDELAESLSRLHRVPTAVIRNGFDPEEIPTSSCDDIGGVASIVYTGRIYDGAYDLAPLLAAAKKLRVAAAPRSQQFRIEFYGPPSRALTLGVREFGLEGFVVPMGQVPREKALEVQSRALALLILGDASPEAKGILTGKVFEYLAARRPILGIGSAEDSAISKLLAGSGAGVALGSDSEKIYMELRALMEGRSPSWFSPREEVIASYSREGQALHVLQLARRLRDKQGCC